MLPCKSYLFLLLVTYATAASLESRALTRSERSADATVVEYDFGGKLHGKCTYTDRTKRGISLVYEEQNGKIKARSLNADVDDPVALVRECRALAEKDSQHVASQPVGDSNLKERSREGRQLIDARDPRFITWLGSKFGSGMNLGSSSANNFGLSWGNPTGSYNPFPGVNLFAPGNSQRLTTTHGGSNPFDFLTSQNTGPWGVLNSISSNNGFFGNGLFGLFNPFGFGK